MEDAFGLRAAWGKLYQRWEDTKIQWNDPVSREFEHKFIMPLAEQGHRTMDVLDRLTQIIERARRNIN